MKEKTKSLDFRNNALAAGFSLLVMAMLAGYANFGVLEAGGSATIAGVLFSGVIVLDIVVAVFLYKFFSVTDKRLSSAALTARILYASIFAVSVGYLFVGNVETFNMIWQAALSIFALHLLWVGMLIRKSDFAPNWLAVLVCIAAIGYAIDSFGTFAVQNYSLDIAAFTFVGEVALLFWLLWICFKSPRISRDRN